MFCALLEFWDDMSKMAVVPGYLSLTLVVVRVICYIYYQDDLTLAYR